MRMVLLLCLGLLAGNAFAFALTPQQTKDVTKDAFSRQRMYNRKDPGTITPNASDRAQEQAEAETSNSFVIGIAAMNVLCGIYLGLKASAGWGVLGLLLGPLAVIAKWSTG
jgi:hypothetical protein